MSNEYDCLIRVVIVGDSGVGKTNLLFRFTKNEFKANLPSTIGIDFSFKNIKVGTKTVRAYIWDTAGQDKFRSISAAYYRGTLAALLVYDITKRESFENLPGWLNELRTYADENVVVMLVGNKCDLGGYRQISVDEGLAFAKENRLSFLETSAMDSINVEKAFVDVVTDAYKILYHHMSEDQRMEVEATATRGVRNARLQTIQLSEHGDTNDESDSEITSPVLGRNRRHPPIKSCCP